MTQYYRLFNRFTKIRATNSLNIRTHSLRGVLSPESLKKRNYLLHDCMNAVRNYSRIARIARYSARTSRTLFTYQSMLKTMVSLTSRDSRSSYEVGDSTAAFLKKVLFCLDLCLSMHAKCCANFKTNLAKIIRCLVLIIIIS